MKKVINKELWNLTLNEKLVHFILFFIFVTSFWLLWDLLYNEVDFYSFSYVYKFLFYCLTYVVILSFNIYYLFKKYYLDEKYFTYFVITFFSFILGFLIIKSIFAQTLDDYYNQLFHDKNIFIRFLINLSTFIMFGTVGLSLELLNVWNNSQKKITTLENLNLKNELQYLKIQINPHFLFNMFNNLYILSQTKPDIALETILNLSDLMRYQLEDASKEFVCLKKEIEYINNLIFLEKIRKDELDFDIDINIIDLNIKIVPMIFAPLVENAIKHGSQKLNRCFIYISITHYDNILEFEIINSKVEDNYSIRNGTGLANLRRRLEICYNDKFNLELKNEVNKYTASLVLRLA